jgi:E3 ubiquitin-protein ligase mind-bomb
MTLGLKVVRGPDWNWGDQDGGEGVVGTIVMLRHQNSDLILNGSVFVQWDTGKKANYRIGRDGSYDLRLFDTSAAGKLLHL